ncbi:hypothetical protein SKAU_G00095860 [Synaphobranchus kaupii]|uniref:HAT C-terminal dimerisation domain-containing protein n=1 Tax=Synaphobranchus kaupii TaxID=118154 RepID=A0A9Q1J6Z3_SYNKA|nr:hypothetical protein SKAU_G00095860 [Synaphobranchus kaupii]
MKQTLLEAVNRRFSSTEGEPLYSVATLVDPRYKDRYFTGAVTANDARDALMREIRKVELLNDGAASATTEPAASTSTEDLASVDAEPVDAEPAEKVPRREEAAGSSQSRPKSSLMALYDNILKEQGDSGTGSNSDVALVQMQKYLKEPTISRSESPFQFWGKKHDSFPAVAAIAVRFLSAPSTSVESERLFSTTSNVVDEKRNRLTAEMTEMIIFLKKNLTKFS